MVVAVADDAEVGDKGREGVVGDFGFGSGDYRKQGGLACIGEPYQAYIGQDFQFEDFPSFDSFFSRLGELGSLHRGRFEEVVAFAASSAFHQDHFFSVPCHFGFCFPAFGIADNGA